MIILACKRVNTQIRSNRFDLSASIRVSGTGLMQERHTAQIEV